jgi:hypothetical protein
MNVRGMARKGHNQIAVPGNSVPRDLPVLEFGGVWHEHHQGDSDDDFGDDPNCCLLRKAG